MHIRAGMCNSELEFRQFYRSQLFWRNYMSCKGTGIKSSQAIDKLRQQHQYPLTVLRHGRPFHDIQAR